MEKNHVKITKQAFSNILNGPKSIFKHFCKPEHDTEATSQLVQCFGVSKYSLNVSWMNGCVTDWEARTRE